MTEIEQKKVECRVHGILQAAFVCQHLLRGENLGFCVPAASDDGTLEAWCNECDMALEQQGWEWNDISEKNLGLTLICSECFEQARRRNGAATRGAAAP